LSDVWSALDLSASLTKDKCAVAEIGARGQRGLAHVDRAAARHRRLAGSGVSRVIAGPAVEPDLRPVLPGDDPKAIMLDLVQPVVTGWP
jgi:hypothetical protein